LTENREEGFHQPSPDQDDNEMMKGMKSMIGINRAHCLFTLSIPFILFTLFIISFVITALAYTRWSGIGSKSFG